ncbi:MAG TPA: response regulator [Elusimicrobiales bacterium]|nr:response regulator [Elusimicrobiales bacterium]
MKIVIADDDQNLLAMLVPHLEYKGHTVLLAVNGAEFLKKIAVTRADLIISDINLPVFDGIELYKKTRELPHYAATPFILWSGIETEKGAAAAAKDLKLRFLKKPFSLAVLQKVMEDLTSMPLFGDNDLPNGRPGLKI